MGDFDLAVGKDIVSAFAGPADYHSFDRVTHKPSTTETVRVNLSEKEKNLNNLYQEVREMRTNETYQESDLKAVFRKLITDFPQDWLLPLEIYELTAKHASDFSKEVLEHLKIVQQQRPKVAHLIASGLQLL